MEQSVKAVLEAIQAQGTEYDAREAEHGKKMLNLEPATAELLSILVRSGGYRRILEIGTSSGYSTIWLANALRGVAETRLVSVDYNADKIAQADVNLRQAGLRDKVELREGAAGDVVEQLAGTFDFVFLDANRRFYPDLLPLILQRLEPRAMLCADNALSHPQEIAPYLFLIDSSNEFESTVAAVGKGLSIAYRDGTVS